MKQPNTALITARVEQIESLKEEVAATNELIKEKFAEMKSEGFDVAAIRVILKERAADPDKLAEQEAIVDLYKSALGMA